MKIKLITFVLAALLFALPALSGCDESGFAGALSSSASSEASPEETLMPDSTDAYTGESDTFAPETGSAPDSSESSVPDETVRLPDETVLPPDDSDEPKDSTDDTGAAGCDHSYTHETVEPTCVSGGYTKHVCALCGDEYTDSQTPATGNHVFDRVIDELSHAGNCTVGGVTVRQCLCGEQSTETTPATGEHSYKFNREVAPGCVTAGYKVFKCEHCYGEVREVTEAAKGHSDTESVSSAPSCTLPGAKLFSCSCGDSDYEAIDPTGHDYKEKVTKESTCESDGLAVYTCSCGDSYEKVLPASHTVVDGKCTACLRKVWDGSADTSWYSASKTEFTLTNGAQLAGLAELVNGGTDFKGKTVKLGDDIDLGNLSWSPIGLSVAPFSGTFDGCDKTVSHIRIDGESITEAGFFGYNAGCIKNLTLSSVSIELKSNKSMVCAGLIAAINGGVIEGCETLGRMEIYMNSYAGIGSIYLYAGGIAGQGTLPSSVSDCSFEGSFDLSHAAGALNIAVGGIVGKNFSASDLSGCTANAEIVHSGYVSNSARGYVWAGGIVGHHSSGTIVNCSSEGSISSAFNATQSYDCELYAGGVIGYMASGRAQGCGSSVALELSSAATSASGGVYGGGFAGYIKGTVSGCFATGSVSGSAVSTGMYMSNCVLGGFVGQNYGGSISQSYATGEVNVTNGNDNAGGGFAGYNMEKGTIENCYSRGKVTVHAIDYVTYGGGFVGVNHYSTVRYCYSAGSVEVSCEKSRAMGGGLAGQNFSGNLLYSYALGSVTVTGVKATGSSASTAGSIVANDYMGDYTGCYYTDGQVLKSNCNSTAKYGSSAAYMTLVGSNFATKTLGWSTDVWKFAFPPTLKIFE